MFTTHTKILTMIFGACLAGTIISAIQDERTNREIDLEETFCRNREENDPEYFNKYTKRAYVEIINNYKSSRVGQIDEDDDK